MTRRHRGKVRMRNFSMLREQLAKAWKKIQRLQRAVERLQGENHELRGQIDQLINPLPKPKAKSG